MNRPNETLIGYRRYDVSLPVWEGPLDLLLDLIRASKVKIQDISIKQITVQYLGMLSLMKKVDIELSADFLVMASTLILLKSRILIAEEMGEDMEDLETPKRELIEKLLLYEQFKKATEKLSEREDHFSHYLVTKERTRRNKSFFREQDQEDLSSGWRSVGLKDLLIAYVNIAEVPEPPTVFQDREYPITEKMSLIVERVKNTQPCRFTDLFPPEIRVHKQEVVVTFWGLLELFKEEIIDARQEKPFGDIFLIPGSRIDIPPIAGSLS